MNAERPEVPVWVADDDLDGSDLLTAVGLLHAEAAGLRNVRSRHPDGGYERPALRISYLYEQAAGWVWMVHYMYAASGRQGRWGGAICADLGGALAQARRIQLVHREALVLLLPQTDARDRRT